MPFELIIFDLDGTLVDSKVDIANSVRYTLKRLGLRDISPEVIYGFVGTGVEPLIRNSLAEAGDGDIDTALSLFRTHYEANLVVSSRPYSGVEPLLKELSDIKKVVLTNKLYSFAKRMVESLSVDRYFEDIFGGDSFPSQKPNSEGVEIILDKFGVKSQNALIVGDSGVDIEAGKGADIVTCGVTYGYRSIEELLSKSPDYLVDAPEEIRDIVCS